jgi:hypothetical protein
MFNSPPPTTPPSPGGLDSASNPLVGVGGDSGVKIKSEFDVTNSFNGGQQQQHRALVAPPRSSLSLFPPPKAGNNNPPPTPPSTPITLKNGKEKNQIPFRLIPPTRNCALTFRLKQSSRRTPQG